MNGGRGVVEVVAEDVEGGAIAVERLRGKEAVAERSAVAAAAVDLALRREVAERVVALREHRCWAYSE